MINSPKIIMNELFRTIVIYNMMWQISSINHKGICEVINDSFVIV
jgi:hypothetical protein